MTTTDPTITIAGLRARINSLLSAVQHSNRTTAERVTMFVEASSNADRLTAERDALAAQLAEVRAELAKAPKVCAIHSYALEGPCMTCGAPWPGAEKALRQERIEGMEKMRRISRAVGCPNSVEEVVEAVAAIKSDLASERARLAAYKERIAGLEQAANERSRTGQMSEPERSEWIGAAVAVADALGGSLGPVAGASGTIDPREWVHFAAGLADRAKKLAARAAKLEWERSRVADAAAESFHHGAWLRLMTAIDPNATITDDALRSLAERTTAQVTADREVARLTARVAELEARPVLTEDALHGAIKEGFGDWRYNHGAQGWPGTIQIAVRALAALGRVTLPAQDRAEELAATLVGTARASMTDVPIAWSCDFADGNENARRALTNVVRTALANLSPAPAPTFDAAFLRRVMVATKHGPNGKGDPGPCDAACVKCEAELMAKAAPAREVAPTLVAVSDEDLGRAVWSKYNNADPAAWPNITIGVRAMWTAAARAVRAKLGAAEVTEERVKAALKLLDGITSSDDLTDDESLDDRVTFFMTSLRASAAKGG